MLKRRGGKPYNPNTAYGRRKRREEAQKYYESLPSDKKDDWDMARFFIFIGYCGNSSFNWILYWKSKRRSKMANSLMQIVSKLKIDTDQVCVGVCPYEFSFCGK